jgi:hypothetical protein
MEKENDKLNATPSKRIFHPMIADYDLNRSVCELVDNGLDVWVLGKRASDQREHHPRQGLQTITVEDNAGGLPKADLRYVVGPGETLNDDDWELPVYEVDPIPEGKTIVELQKLRSPVTDEPLAPIKFRRLSRRPLVAF